MTKTIGVIGLGSIGMRHAKNLRAMGHLILGTDPDEKKMLELRAGVGMGWNLADQVDAFVIASPTEFHCQHLCDTVGKPTFVEKPIADVRPLLYNHITMVGYNLRWHSCVKKAKEWLDAGLIGENLSASFWCGQYNNKPPYLRDGVILNWSHEIDLALYLLGPAAVAASSTRLTDGHDDMTDILLTHKSGCRSSVHLDYVTQPEQRGFTITGSLGVIRANLRARGIRITSMSKDGVFAFQDTYDENYIEEMHEFLNRIDFICPPPHTYRGCTGVEALKVLEICLEVRKQAGL